MSGLFVRYTWPLALMRFADRVPIINTRLMRHDPNGFSRPSVRPILHYVTLTLPNSLTPYASRMDLKLPEQLRAFDMFHHA